MGLGVQAQLLTAAALMADIAGTPAFAGLIFAIAARASGPFVARRRSPAPRFDDIAIGVYGRKFERSGESIGFGQIEPKPVA